jgi:hypothetical protein
LVAAIRHFLKSNSKVVNKPWREGEKGLRVYLDISKARERLGYEPMVNLLDGIRNTALYIASDVLGWDEKALDELRHDTFGIPAGGKRVGEVLKSTLGEDEEPAGPTGVPSAATLANDTAVIDEQEQQDLTEALVAATNKLRNVSGVTGVSYDGINLVV